MPLKCLMILKNFSTKLRAQERTKSQARLILRFDFGGMTGVMARRSRLSVNASRIIPLVGEEGLRLDLFDQLIGFSHVVDLAAGQADAKGLPRASTTAWIFVVNPPRERPMAWS